MPRGTDIKSDDMISVAEYAAIRGMLESAVHSRIRSGILTGAEIEGVWYVLPPNSPSRPRNEDVPA